MDSFTVQAEYTFKGSNNDELCFKKGDIITVTQREDGGWWEGTLNDKTGWFPSNYVTEYKGTIHYIIFNLKLFNQLINVYKRRVCYCRMLQQFTKVYFCNKNFHS